MKEKIIKKTVNISIMSSLEPLREVVKKLADTFNDRQKRESSYFDFYDDSLIIHGFPPNLPANKEGFKKFIYLLWKAFPDIRIIFDDIIIEKNKVACRKKKKKKTDKEFTVNGMTVFYFHDTKCIERWNLVDMISLGEQLRTQS